MDFSEDETDTFDEKTAMCLKTEYGFEEKSLHKALENFPEAQRSLQTPLKECWHSGHMSSRELVLLHLNTESCL